MGRDVDRVNGVWGGRETLQRADMDFGFGVHEFLSFEFAIR
jgi:hypothetical protein